MLIYVAHQQRVQYGVGTGGDDEDQSTGPKWSSTKPRGLPTVGFVGHPNVGKSSLLNSLVKKHVVSVSRTCGHTKYLQTYLVRRDVDSELVGKAHELRQKSTAAEEEEEEEEEESNRALNADCPDGGGLNTNDSTLAGGDEDSESAGGDNKNEGGVQLSVDGTGASAVDVSADESDGACQDDPQAARDAQGTDLQTHEQLTSTTVATEQGEIGDKDRDVVLELCDCPGLIFPVLGYTTASGPVERDVVEFVPTPFSPRALFECNGLYPIPQIREPFSAVRLLAESFVELPRVYNLKLDKDDYGEEWSPQGRCVHDDFQMLLCAW
jgi:hypothetical protein